MDFDSKTLVLWDAYAAARTKQIHRWLQTARELRGSEFTPAKEAAWMQAEIDRDTRFRISLNLTSNAA